MTETTPDPGPRTPAAYVLLRQEVDDNSTKKLGLLIALLLHLLIITLTLPSLARRTPTIEPARAPIRALKWIPAPPDSPPRPQRTFQESLQARLIPIPDPTPAPPEPFSEPPGRAHVAPTPSGENVDIVSTDAVPPPSNGPVVPGFGGVSFPVLRPETQVLPRYPALARRAGVTGQVYLKAVVRKDGTVGDIRVLRSPGVSLGFDAAAIDAVRQWRYHPGIQNGRKVDVVFTIVVDFVLE
jgi:protein TonB